MLSYQQIDIIADSFIPLLLLLCILIISINFIRRRRHTGISQLTILLLGIAYVYAIYWLDKLLNLWTKLGWDYSTHTALALMLSVFLFSYIKKLRYWIALLFVTYLLIMLYQQYHTIQDMVSTIIIILPVSILLIKTKPRLIIR